MAGRVEAYIHSDNVTPNKGGCLIEVRCQTDFAARTDEFISFAKRAAKLMYGFSSGNWKELVEACPSIEEEKDVLQSHLREEIRIGRVATLRIDDA